MEAVGSLDLPRGHRTPICGNGFSCLLDALPVNVAPNGRASPKIPMLPSPERCVRRPGPTGIISIAA